MDSDCSIWVLYPFNDIWEMAEKSLDSETALHISGHVYHQQSNVTCDRDVGVSSPSHPDSKTSTMLSAWALSLPQTALWASWSCPGCRRNLSPWRSPTTSFVGCHLWALSLSHPPLSVRRRCLADLQQTARGAEASNNKFETIEIA